MYFRTGSVGALLLACLLSACVTPTPVHVALAPKAEENFPPTEVVAPIAQSEIYVYVPPTTAGAGQGLIGALLDASVDAYRAGTAEKDVKALRDTVVDLNFDADLTAQLKTSLSQIAWLHVDGVRVMKEVATKKIDGAITGSKDGAVLIAVADYQLSNDGQQLIITVHADLYPNGAALAAFRPAKGRADTPSDPSNSIYRNSFTFISTLPGPLTKRDANMAAWTAFNGAAFRTAMKVGVAKLGEMIAMDLQDSQPNPAASPAASPAAGPAAGAVLVQDSEGDLSRQFDGSLVYVAK